MLPDIMVSQRFQQRFLGKKVSICGFWSAYNVPAVSVFPVPGPPCSKIISPLPFPSIISSTLPVAMRTWTSAVISSLVFESRTSLSKARLFHSIGWIPPTSSCTASESAFLSHTESDQFHAHHFFSCSQNPYTTVGSNMTVKSSRSSSQGILTGH
jgi:hypothetical protein